MLFTLRPSRWRATRGRRVLAPSCLAIALVLSTAGCSADGDADCERLAQHKQALLAESLSPSVRDRVATDSQRDALVAACEKQPPEEHVARCQLESRSIGQFMQCGKRQESER